MAQMQIQTKLGGVKARANCCIDARVMLDNLGMEHKSTKESGGESQTA